MPKRSRQSCMQLFLYTTEQGARTSGTAGRWHRRVSEWPPGHRPSEWPPLTVLEQLLLRSSRLHCLALPYSLRLLTLCRRDRRCRGPCHCCAGDAGMRRDQHRALPVVLMQPMLGLLLHRPPCLRCLALVHLPILCRCRRQDGLQTSGPRRCSAVFAVMR